MQAQQPVDELQTPSWQDRLERATSESSVLDIVRDFLATVTPYEIARLPEKIRPGKVGGTSDVSAYAFELVSLDCEDNQGSQRVLHRLANFFSRASIRLSQIMTPRHTSLPRRSEDRAL